MKNNDSKASMSLKLTKKLRYRWYGIFGLFPYSAIHMRKRGAFACGIWGSAGVGAA